MLLTITQLRFKQAGLVVDRLSRRAKIESNIRKTRLCLVETKRLITECNKFIYCILIVVGRTRPGIEFEQTFTVQLNGLLLFNYTFCALAHNVTQNGIFHLLLV